ncbi:MAG TPA: hypothetical protein VFW66_09435 [Gemmatimonadales bacterium]|nr:hypothetical protein [Gemmatimonadales bacterium]
MPRPIPRVLSAALLAAGAIAPPRAIPAATRAVSASVADRQDEPALPFRVVRFYRAKHRHTRVAAFLAIPSSLVQPTGSGADAQFSYEVTFRLMHAGGDRPESTVDEQTWRSRVPARSRGGRICAVETMEFMLPAGRYRVEAVVRDSVSGREARAGVDLVGYDAPPRASDLLLSPEIRAASAEDSMPRRGEFRRGSVLVSAVAVLHLTPTRSTAYYLLEVYGSHDPSRATAMSLAVRDASGAVVRRTRPLPAELLPGGSVLRGKVDLAGLPPGRYELSVALTLDGARVARSAAFTMDAADSTASSSRN